MGRASAGISPAACCAVPPLQRSAGRSGKITRLREMLCGTEQHRGMAIVTAGMHPSALLRSMGKRVLLLDM